MARDSILGLSHNLLLTLVQFLSELWVSHIVLCRLLEHRHSNFIGCKGGLSNTSENDFLLLLEHLDAFLVFSLLLFFKELPSLSFESNVLGIHDVDSQPGDD